MKNYGDQISALYLELITIFSNNYRLYDFMNSNYSFSFFIFFHDIYLFNFSSCFFHFENFLIYFFQKKLISIIEPKLLHFLHLRKKDNFNDEFNHSLSNSGWFESWLFCFTNHFNRFCHIHSSKFKIAALIFITIGYSLIFIDDFLHLFEINFGIFHYRLISKEKIIQHMKM
jgi:hypothetical protein